MKNLIIFIALQLLIFSNGILQAQWTQTYGPYGGQINCLTVTGNNIFGGTFSGVFRSTNNGIKWTHVGPSNIIVNALASQQNNIIAGTYSQGLFLSTNDGIDWSQVGSSFTEIGSLAFSGNNIFVGTRTVYLSTNYGTNWTQVDNGIYGAVYSLAASDTNVFAGTDFGMYTTNNNGTNWTKVNNGMTGTGIHAINISRPYFFAGTESGVFISSNNGIDWTQAINSPAQVLSFAANGTNVFASVNGGVYISTDNGTNWTQVNNGLTNLWVPSLAVIGTDIFAGTTDGLFLSTDNGVDWTLTGLPCTHVYCLAVINNNIIAADEHGICISTNNGTDWILPDNNLNYLGVFNLVVSGTNIFAGTNYQGVFLSTDMGINWTKVGLNGDNVRAIAVSGNNIFAAAEAYSGLCGVYLSTNNGKNWALVNNGLTGYERVFSFALNGDNIFAGTDGGVYLSTNNGSIWTKVSNGLPYSSVLSLSVSGNNIFAGTYYGVYLSTDNGTNWTHVNNGLSDMYPVNALLTNGNNIYAGTAENGIFLTTDNGTSWKPLNNGLTNYNIYSFTISGTTIFAGTASAVWKRNLSDIESISKNVNELPKSYSLSQNYPNPFNPTTTISYRLKDKGFVKLNVYDITGNLIKTLVSQTKDPGSYETEFNAKGLPSGIYFYRLEVFTKGSSLVYSDIKKLVLLK